MHYAKTGMLIASSLLAFGISVALAQVDAGGLGLDRGQSGGTLGLISSGGTISSNLEAPAKVSAPPESKRVFKRRGEKAAVADDDDDRPKEKKAKKKKKDREREIAEKERRKRTGFKTFARRYGYSRY